MASFTQKVLEFRFTLATGNFINQNGNTKIIRGLRASVVIDKPGIPAKNEAKGTIFGVRKEDVEQLTTLAYRPLSLGRHLVEIYAGDSESDLHLAFRGDVAQAYGDYNRQPDVNFYFEAQTGLYNSVAPIPPFSTSEGSAADIFRALASQMGLAFVNNGVQATVKETYLKGTAYNQALTLANALNIDLTMDDNTMFISNVGKPVGEVVFAPVISKATGMIGYPQFSQSGLTIKSIYNPALRVGHHVKVESEITRASGLFRATGIKHDLSCELPSGKWQTQIEVSYIANPLFTV